MDLNEAHELARALMKKHGLIDRGWRFNWDRARRRLGQCNYTTHTISLSHYMVAEADVTAVEQTLLHEIAHALTPGAQHGPRWLAKARAIGYTGARTAENPYLVKQDRLRLPSHLRDLEADTMLRAGQPAVVIRGGDLIGQQVRVLRRNDKTYSIETTDGRRFRISRNSLAPVPAGVEVAVPDRTVSPTLERLNPGQNGVITVGRHQGAKVRIVEKRRTRYVADIEGLGPRLVPMHMVGTA